MDVDGVGKKDDNYDKRITLEYFRAIKNLATK